MVSYIDQSGHRNDLATSIHTPPSIKFGFLTHCSNINVLLHIAEPDSLGQVDKSLKEITGKLCHSLMDTLCQGTSTAEWRLLTNLERFVQSGGVRVMGAQIALVKLG